MKFFERSHVYPSDWETVTAAWWVKYPNKGAPHVKEVHTIDRCMCDREFSVKRLFYLEYGLPIWVQKMFKMRMEGWAVEDIKVCKEPKKLTATGKNITFGSFFQMTEEICFQENPIDHSQTLFTQKMSFDVKGFGSIIGNRLESAARDNAEGKSTQGLSVLDGVIKKLRENDWKSKAEEVARGAGDWAGGVAKEAGDKAGEWAAKMRDPLKEFTPKLKCTEQPPDSKNHPPKQ